MNLSYKEYELINDNELSERDCQKHIVRFYRSFIAPIYIDCKLIVNPFTEKKLTPKEINIYKSLGYEAKQPDLMFIQSTPQHNGLAIELKRKNEVIRNKSGQLKTKHLKEQYKFILSLRKQNFRSEFSFGIVETIQTLKEYFRLNQLIK